MKNRMQHAARSGKAWRAGACLVALALALGACRSKTKCPELDAGVAIVVASASSAPPDAAPKTIRVSLAQFADDGLNACTDLTAPESARDPDGGKAAKRDKNIRKIEQSCEEAFSDRKEFATCTLTITDDAGVPITAVIRYYNAATLDDDNEMKGCLESGRWHAVSREDPEYKRSLLKGHAKAVQRSVRQLQQLQNQAEEE